MIKVLFICHGNICRSPMAEFILKDMVKKLGIEAQFTIDSAATSTEEIWNGIGNPVYPKAKAQLAYHGIECEGKRAVQLKMSDYEKYDYLIGMDSMNMRNMEKITGHKRNEKMKMLLEYTGENRSVIDPWYSDNFDEAYNDIYKGVEAFLNIVLKK